MPSMATLHPKYKIVLLRAVGDADHTATTSRHRFSGTPLLFLC